MTRNFDNDCHELIKQAQAGRKHAFTKLVENHYGLVIYYLLDLGLDRSDAEDLAQEIFIKTFSKISQFKFNGAFASWILQIAKNHFIDNLRKEKRKSWNNAEVELDEIPDCNSPESQVVSDSAVKVVFKELKPREKIVIELRVFQKLQFSEIAEIIGSNEGNVRLIFHRIIKKLRNLSKEKFE